MTKRPLLIVLLLVAFLLSAWGNVIGAAFCPGYLSRNCHIAQETQKSKRVDPESCHHEMTDTGEMKMDDMQMGDMQMESDSPPDTEAAINYDNLPTLVATESFVEWVDLPAEPCGHCSMHSQAPAGTATLAAVDPSPRSAGTDAPSPELEMALPAAIPIPITPLEHSPPGNSFPRHIFINVFRI